MEKIEVMQKVDELMFQQGGIVESLKDECARLLSSGGLSYVDEETGSFLPSKILVTVALRNLAFRYEPFTARKEVKNLEKF